MRAGLPCVHDPLVLLVAGRRVIYLGDEDLVAPGSLGEEQQLIGAAREPLDRQPAGCAGDPE